MSRPARSPALGRGRARSSRPKLRGPPGFCSSRSTVMRGAKHRSRRATTTSPPSGRRFVSATAARPQSRRSCGRSVASRILASSCGDAGASQMGTGFSQTQPVDLRSPGPSVNSSSGEAPRLLELPGDCWEAHHPLPVRRRRRRQLLGQGLDLLREKRHCAAREAEIAQRGHRKLRIARGAQATEHPFEGRLDPQLAALQALRCPPCAFLTDKRPAGWDVGPNPEFWSDYSQNPV